MFIYKHVKKKIKEKLSNFFIHSTKTKIHGQHFKKFSSKECLRFSNLDFAI